MTDEGDHFDLYRQSDAVQQLWYSLLDRLDALIGIMQDINNRGLFIEHNVQHVEMCIGLSLDLSLC